MKTKYLLLVGLVVILGSCSTAYRSGQTPDDVYYSPVPATETYVVKQNSSDGDSYSSRNSDERDIRRAIRDPRYRSTVTFDVGYGYNPFGYNPYAYNPFGYNTNVYNSFGYNSYGYNSYGYNPYSFNNYGKGFYDPFGYNPYNSYNPYYPSYGYNPYYGSYYPPVNYYPVAGKTSNNTGPRKYNLGNYVPSGTPSGNKVNNTFVPNQYSAPVRSFNNRTTPAAPVQRERTGVGNVIQRVFTPSEPRTSTPSNRRTFSNPPTRSTQSSNESRTMERRSNDNPAPTRSFDPPARSTPAPTRTFDPPASSTPPPASNNSSAPVRTFKNN